MTRKRRFSFEESFAKVCFESLCATLKKSLACDAPAVAFRLTTELCDNLRGRKAARRR